MDDENDNEDEGDDVDNNDVDNTIICIYLVIFVCYHSVLKESKKYKVNVIIK